MRTYKFEIVAAGSITLPDKVRDALREMASESPEDGGDPYLHNLHKEFYTDDDAFLQAALKNALRGMVRSGLLADIGTLGAGVGCRIAPATVVVGVPERVGKLVAKPHAEVLRCVDMSAVPADADIEPWVDPRIIAE